ncbi:MAG: spondin domain-containing protein [Actinomycetota bacterium]
MARRRVAILSLIAALCIVALAPVPAAGANGRLYRVTIVNRTHGQPLSPPVVAIHRKGFSLFEVGSAASFGLKEIAENGNNGPMLQALASTPAVFKAKQGGDEPLVPEGTPGSATFDDRVTFKISAPRSAKFASFATMLVCTNDGFTGASRFRLPAEIGDRTVVRTAGYDAGTEINTEDFADMVPPCQELIGVSSGEPGTGTSDPALAEGGVITHHPGIEGIADLVPSVHGWNDPAARISVTRIR